MSNVQRLSKKIGLNTLISWGASVVIIGLTFKILHWRGGEWMIGLGLLVEACLFFLLGYAAMSDNSGQALTFVPEETERVTNNKLDDVLATNIDADVLDRLKTGFEKFNKTVESVNSVAGSAETTQKMLVEIEHATIEIQELRKNIAELNNAYRSQLEAFRKA